MKIINKSSLSITLDNLNQVFFDGKKLSAPEKKKASEWIASRQGLPGSYWYMFGPTISDYNGIRLFTGELISSRAGVGHFLGEESLRTLYMLGVKDKAVVGAITKATNGLKMAIKRFSKNNYPEGTYCCSKCSVAYWRNLSAEGVEKNRKLLNSGLKYLNSKRDGKGKWKSFPFYYTVLALSGIDLPAAKEELRYASPALERIVRKKPTYDIYSKRRFFLAERVLSTI